MRITTLGTVKHSWQFIVALQGAVNFYWHVGLCLEVCVTSGLQIQKIIQT